MFSFWYGVHTKFSVRRSFQLLAWSEGVAQLYDWLLSSGEKESWSDVLSLSNPRVLHIFCRTDFRRLITLMTSFISCHDSRLWKSSTLGRDKKEYVSLEIQKYYSIARSSFWENFTLMASLLWSVTLGKWHN